MPEFLVSDEIEFTETVVFLAKRGQRKTALMGTESGTYYQPKPGAKFDAEECAEKFEPVDPMNAMMPIKKGNILHLVVNKEPHFAQPDRLVKVVRILGAEECFLEVKDRNDVHRNYSLFEAAVELEASGYTDFPDLPA